MCQRENLGERSYDCTMTLQQEDMEGDEKQQSWLLEITGGQK